jgi:hypothetical protein
MILADSIHQQQHHAGPLCRGDDDAGLVGSRRRHVPATTPFVQEHSGLARALFPVGIYRSPRARAAPLRSGMMAVARHWHCGRTVCEQCMRVLLSL